jgi:hypothetical protein
MTKRKENPVEDTKPLVVQTIKEQMDNKRRLDIKVLASEINQIVSLSTSFRMSVQPHAFDLEATRRPRRRAINRLVNLYRSLRTFTFNEIDMYQNGFHIYGSRTSDWGRHMMYRFWVPNEKVIDPLVVSGFRKLTTNGHLIISGFHNKDEADRYQEIADLLAEFFEDLFREYALTKRKRGRPRKYPLVQQEVPHDGQTEA